jgi:hypothetical protein
MLRMQVQHPQTRRAATSTANNRWATTEATNELRIADSIPRRTYNHPSPTAPGAVRKKARATTSQNESCTVLITPRELKIILVVALRHATSEIAPIAATQSTAEKRTRLLGVPDGLPVIFAKIRAMIESRDKREISSPRIAAFKYETLSEVNVRGRSSKNLSRFSASFTPPGDSEILSAS